MSVKSKIILHRFLVVALRYKSIVLERFNWYNAEPRRDECVFEYRTLS